MKIENLLKRLCYKRQKDNWYKTLGYSLILVKITDEYLHMAQVFKSKKDNDIAVWNSDKEVLSKINTISDLIALEVTICRDIYYFDTDEDGLNLLIPQLSLADIMEEL